MKVLSVVVNNPIFIEMQYKSLTKYINSDFEFIVFNDAKEFPDVTNSGDTSMRYRISETCKKLSIRCIEINNGHHAQEKNASRRHSESVNIMYEFMKAYRDIYLVIDSDMFLVDHFDIKDYEMYTCACVLQERLNIRYFWPNYFILNTEKIEFENDLNFSIVPGADSGGGNSVWLRKLVPQKFPTCNEIRRSPHQYKCEKLYLIKGLWSGSWDETEFPENLNSQLLDFVKSDPRNTNGKFFCEIYDNRFLHLRGQSNWDLSVIDQNKILVSGLVENFDGIIMGSASNVPPATDSVSTVT